MQRVLWNQVLIIEIKPYIIVGEAKEGKFQKEELEIREKSLTNPRSTGKNGSVGEESGNAHYCI